VLLSEKITWYICKPCLRYSITRGYPDVQILSVPDRPLWHTAQKSGSGGSSRAKVHHIGPVFGEAARGSPLRLSKKM
jgi:hypothetical protein